MLINAKLYTVLSTTDLERAKKFYGETLGLKPFTMEGAPQGHALFQTEGGDILQVYLRQAAPKAENTVACFHVKDVAAEVVELKAKGVVFEEYDFPGLKTENGIATTGALKASWFKDPDGNIISVIQIG